MAFISKRSSYAFGIAAGLSLFITVPILGERAPASEKVAGFFIAGLTFTALVGVLLYALLGLVDGFKNKK